MRVSFKTTTRVESQLLTPKGAQGCEASYLVCVDCWKPDAWLYEDELINAQPNKVNSRLEEQFLFEGPRFVDFTIRPSDWILDPCGLPVVTWFKLVLLIF